MRIALKMSYDGTDFFGFARQPQQRSVQGELERWLSTILREPVEIVGAGRTDAGVHAAGQVVSFNTTADTTGLVERLNKVLGPEIMVHARAVVDDEFSARFSATAREYEYRIYSGPGRDPFRDRFALWVEEPLDARAMHDAAQVFLGEHDFSAFCRASGDASLVRRVTHIAVRDDLTVEVHANAFCHQMVRSITGTLLMVGLGTWDGGRVARALDSKDREGGAHLAHPRGLTLMRVRYEPEPSWTNP